MLFRNFYNLNKLLKELNSFDDSFFDQNPYLSGSEKTESGVNNNGEWEKKTFISDDGLFSYSFFTKRSGGKKEIDNMSKLKRQLDIAVESQDFEMAVELRDKIKKLEENKEELKKLNDELEEYIKNQDFENAIIVRDKIKSLK